MLTDNLTNKHKLSSETYSTKNSTKVTLYSSKKVQVPKDPLNISYSRPKKKLLINSYLGLKCEASPSVSKNLQFFPKYSKSTNSATSASYSIQLLESRKSIFSSNKCNERPISVGWKNARPIFLEPEVSEMHIPNKSAIISSNSCCKEVEEHYRFPDIKFRGNLARFS